MVRRFGAVPQQAGGRVASWESLQKRPTGCMAAERRHPRPTRGPRIEVRLCPYRTCRCIRVHANPEMEACTVLYCRYVDPRPESTTGIGSSAAPVLRLAFVSAWWSYRTRCPYCTWHSRRDWKAASYGAKVQTVHTYKTKGGAEGGGVCCRTDPAAGFQARIGTEKGPSSGSHSCGRQLAPGERPLPREATVPVLYKSCRLYSGAGAGSQLVLPSPGPRGRIKRVPPPASGRAVLMRCRPVSSAFFVFFFGRSRAPMLARICTLPVHSLDAHYAAASWTNSLPVATGI